MECRIISPSKARRRGFTLPEMLAGMGLAGFLVAVVSALALFSGINFACLINYTDMNTDSINAMNRITYDIRRSDSATSYSSNSITVTNHSGTITYAYNSATKEVTRTENAVTTVLLKSCDNFRFIPYQRTPLSNSITQFELTSTNNDRAKAFFATWTCSRTVLGRKLTTDSTSAGRVVLRVK
ncbi:MAG: hypothetical protein RJA22_2910 [Verrucomicrobiota bacterium]|jgi:prepilin-type N-terminal cleavage/methylation domain-containing protein